MSSVEVVPTIIVGTVAEVEEKIRKVKGKVERVQVDVVDGLFADNLTVTPRDLQNTDFGELKIDVHLMVEDPVEWVMECAMIKPDRVIAQIERMGNQYGFVSEVKELEMKAGLAVDLHTPIEGLEEDALSEVEVVLVMGYEAGEGGKGIEEKVFEKVERLREMYDGLIQVDGGVNPDNVGELVEAGADEVAVGSYLWEGDLVRRLREIKDAV